ncbi:MAG: hypothetical protein ACREIT_10790 [Tepidisphaeraceae bacterium]
MLHELLPLLPREVGTVALVVAVVGTLVGAGLWLAGSRFSRSLLTLLAVAAGALVGRALPKWCDWSVDGMGLAVGGAVVLGISAYAMHRVWVAGGLGFVMACWAALATWVVCAGDAGHGWAWPGADASTTAPMFLRRVWESLPEEVARYLPWACGTAMASGMSVALLWPRLGVVLLHSTAGGSMLVCMGTAALEYGRSQWLDALPSKTWAQIMTVAALIAFGAVVQWKLAPAGAGKAPPADAKGKG